jgi:hypothetical protein
MDDSDSTSEHWDSMVNMLSLLSFILEGDDPDGAELHFTNSDERRTSPISDNLVATAKQVVPRGRTDISPRLTRIFKDYERRLRENKDIRPLSVYVLTDGVWARSEESPAIPLLALVQALKDTGKTRRQVGVQFVSFGSDEEGLERMQQLDDMNKSFGLEK